MTTCSPMPLLTRNHKEAFKQIRNFLAGRFVGATRDRALLEEVLKCLFCKVFLNGQAGEARSLLNAVELSEFYSQTFVKLKSRLPTVFNANDELLLDPESIAFIDRQLTHIDLSDASHDFFGDLYELFITTGIREEEGQFFTPKTGIDVLVSLVDPKIGEKFIDPACGAGGFLASVAQHLRSRGATAEQITANVFGIDKDAYLTKLASTRLSLFTLCPTHVFCADSLSWRNAKDQPLELEAEGFDVVLTNPPFGKRIVSVSATSQAGFELGYKWRPTQNGSFDKTSKLLNSVPPQVLFVERCLGLLRPNGRLGIVVPESLITGKSYGHVVHFVRTSARIEAVIGMPEEFFKTSGKGGTHTKVCLVTMQKQSTEGNQPFKIFMAEANWCGHDSRGRQISHNDLPSILRNYTDLQNGRLKEESHLGYALTSSLLENNVLSPRYYDPEVKSQLSRLAHTHNLVRVGDLVRDGLLTIQTGDEVGKLTYGTGEIPFIRTSDISNWEIKIDPKHAISEEIYQKLAKKQDVSPGDILMVKDGTYLIGTCAFITEYDTRIVYQSHLYKLRLTDHEKLSPYLVLAILSSEPVQKQIKAKRFTQDIIDSLGARINELVLPIPKDRAHAESVIGIVERAIRDRIEARELARRACLQVISAA
jgi:type I restriction enzyme M protein